MKNQMFLFGKHAVLNALKNPQRKVIRLYITEKNSEKWEEEWGDLSSYAYDIKTAAQMDEILGKKETHQGFILSVLQKFPESLEDFFQNISDTSIVVVLDQVTDPHNVGAILRSCAVFGVGAVVVPERHSASTEGIVSKVASGAMEHVPMIAVGNLKNALAQLQSQGFWIYGLDERGASTLAEVSFSGRVGLVFGAEGAGLRRLTKDTCDMLISLPSHGNFSTLNVSTTVAVTLYEAAQQLRLI